MATISIFRSPPRRGNQVRGAGVQRRVRDGWYELGCRVAGEGAALGCAILGDGGQAVRHPVRQKLLRTDAVHAHGELRLANFNDQSSEAGIAGLHSQLSVGVAKTTGQMAKVLYLDQNAWVDLARGAWDKSAFPKEHAALETVIKGLRSQAIVVPLSYANIYETAKINNLQRRAHLAHIQATISKGRVFRGRRRILTQSLKDWLANHFYVAREETDPDWYLSDLWFEAAVDYSPEQAGFELSLKAIGFISANPAAALLDFLTQNDEPARKEAVQAFSVSSAALIQQIEARRARVAGERLELRQRAYAAMQLIEELDFILSIGQQLGQKWYSVTDIGRSISRRLADEIPVFRAERELAVRLEDQARPIVENDLRDMSAFATVLPMADFVIGEKLFVNLARQGRLDKLYNTTLLTSVFELSNHL